MGTALSPIGDSTPGTLLAWNTAGASPEAGKHTENVIVPTDRLENLTDGADR